MNKVDPFDDRLAPRMTRRRREAGSTSRAMIATDAPAPMVEALSSCSALTDVVAVDLSRSVDELLESVGVLHPEDWEGPAVVLLHDGNRTARVAAARVRAMAPQGAVLPIAANLPPLARACGALVLAELAKRQLAASLVAAVAPYAIEEMQVCARLISVARLRRPPPTFAQHLRSYVPGSTFLATVQPRATVTAWSSRAVQGLPPPPTGSVLVTCSAKDDEGVDELRAFARGHAVVAVPPDPSSAAWWGSRSVAEAVMVPGALSLDRLADVVLEDAVGCRWCRRSMCGLTCASCGMFHADDAERAS